MTASAPWSHCVVVSEIPQAGLAIDLVADVERRAALAAHCGLASVEEARATLLVTRRGRDGARVKGALHAKAHQICVVTLEPFPTTIVETIDVEFAPVATRGPAVEGAEGPDPIIGGKVDVGALVVEFLALGIDPYPRKPGARYAAPDDPAADASPFSALKAAKPRPK